MQITDNMRKDILKAVCDLESSTSGEMVCMVAQSSARYILYPLLWAAFAALVLPVANPVLAILGRPPAVTFEIQSVAFVMLSLVLLYTPLRACVTPRSVLEMNCSRRAFEQFFIRRLHETSRHTGVLLFVSVEERYAELIADDGINDKVAESEWRDIIAAFTTDLRKGRVHEGFLSAIAACQALMARHFPDRCEKNELPDHLVELPKSRIIS